MAVLPTWSALCVHALPDGGSRLVDLNLPVTHKVTAADGTSRWEGVADASHWGLAGGGSSSTHHEWHTCGQAGLSITLRGRWEIEASDGTRRVLGPGDVLVMLDTTGQGHRSWPLDDGDTMVLGVGLGEHAERDMRALLATLPG